MRTVVLTPLKRQVFDAAVKATDGGQRVFKGLLIVPGLPSIVGPLNSLAAMGVLRVSILRRNRVEKGWEGEIEFLIPPSQVRIEEPSPRARDPYATRPQDHSERPIKLPPKGAREAHWARTAKGMTFDNHPNAPKAEPPYRPGVTYITRSAGA